MLDSCGDLVSDGRMSTLAPSETEAVFTPDDLRFFDDHGYVILKEAVPKESVAALVDTIFEFLGISRERDESWYRPPVSAGGGMVEIYQHQHLWNHRQSPRIYSAFRQLWGRDELHVSIDRASFKTPEDPEHPKYQKTGFLHLDTKTDILPIPFRLQGVLYLVDTEEDQGGFHCLPGWHKRTEEWIEVSKPEGSLKGDAMYELPIKPIPAKAGDFLIWHIGLPHGNGYNRSDRPRMAQYISMWPAKGFDHPKRNDPRFSMENRIRAWREHSGPPVRARPFPGDDRNWEIEHGATAELTPLGRKLLGVDAW